MSDLPERPIGLTLFRATRRTVMTDGEPNGQLQGDLRFRYWIAPLAGEPDRAALCRLGQRLEGGLRAVYSRRTTSSSRRSRAAIRTAIPTGARPSCRPPQASWM